MAAVVETLDPYVARTRNERKKSRQAETTLEKFHPGVVLCDADCGIDHHVKSNRLSFAQGQLLRSDFLVVFLAILNDGDLKRQPDLRSGQTHAGRSAHGFAHMLDQLLYLFAADLLRGERTTTTSENRLSGLDDW